MTYDAERVMAADRALGTHLSGALKRADFPNREMVEAVHLRFSNSAIPGNGLGAFLDNPMDILVEGGTQDGVTKCARGEQPDRAEGLNHDGERLDELSGQKLCLRCARRTLYRPGRRRIPRACIHLSSADVIFGGELRQPLAGFSSVALAHARSLKGYAFEYMTSGRALVLGDIGPWACSGMTGGVIYQRIQPGNEPRHSLPSAGASPKARPFRPSRSPKKTRKTSVSC